MLYQGTSLANTDVAEPVAHPLLRAWSVEKGDVPPLAVLEGLRVAASARDGVGRPAFRTQTRALLADGLHYEARIAERGELATREGDPHDWFNALVWLRHPRLKWALNARQVADLDEVGPKRRTRGQCALTHFDEAGAIVWLADPGLLPVWDAHDWESLFHAHRRAWGHSIAVTVFGHALVEHVWNGHDLPVAKALAVAVPASALAGQAIDEAAILAQWPQVEADVASAIIESRALGDPQELRPLPLAGIPGWHRRNGDPAFLREAPCFRPLRPGRRYPAPMDWELFRRRAVSFAAPAVSSWRE